MKNKKYLILIFVVFAFLILIGYFYFRKTDGMLQVPKAKVYYRLHYNGRWSKWVKNSVSNKKGTDYIDMIELKTKSLDSGDIAIQVYSRGKWSKDNVNKTTKKNNYISGIKASTIGKLNRKYTVCYRTYNNVDKWMEWSCNGMINGNKKEKIINIEFKIVPKEVPLNEFLRDYESEDKINSKNF